MKNYIYYLLIVFFFFSCNKKEEEIPAPIKPAYKIMNYEKDWGDCDSTGAPCAELKIEYPLLTNFYDEEIKEKINKAIINTLLIPYNDKGSYLSFDSLANDFLESYKQFENEYPDNHQRWAMERKIKVENLSDSIFSLSKEEYYYMGGAHPNSTTNFINFDLQSGNAIELTDIIEPGYQEQLNKIAEDIFRKKQGLEPGETLSDAGYWFEDDKFKLNDNFLIEEIGLLFVFNPYEVAAYAVGEIEVFIPIEKLEEITIKH